ncbi:hypothetical protein PDESU_02218 [Pontiella desulfatans]|uniref:DUF5060 domain-containing protein n=1 Tax=Pontiella desulfatans TaxID=2750659 RepID=A0A6C2U253_PONDE|nr:DUF5060 domain-containing protein [Pontiella desulfatans]VGO13661.1 hypothetical protein PDESU_02218 [Pontiella desulfatans]
MKINGLRVGLVTVLVLLCVNGTLARPLLEGNRVLWHPLTISFSGPVASEMDQSPNPFLDYRMQVQLTAPSGKTVQVPGYFDGDGKGGATGSVWRVKFSPDEAGKWRYTISFRQGPNVSISLVANEGKALAFDGEKGTFTVKPRNPEADGFYKWGLLEYAGGHYLKFRDGSYWIRGGVDSPENFLAYAGFDDTPPKHAYAVHTAAWREGDPDWNDGKGKAIIGALNDLAERKVNSLYFLTMNIGGDGKDVWPWAGTPNPKGAPENDNLHFDLSKLRQWEMVFSHAQRKGIFLHVVLNEAEAPNKQELDNGELGIERKLYYRELIARFGHHLAMGWNLCEEYNIGFDFGPDRIRAFADYIQAVDPYQHPISVHTAHDPLKELAFTFGDPRFSMTSIQLNRRRIDTLVEDFRKATAEAGRPVPISMDEFVLDVGQEQGWKPFDRPVLHRKQRIWPTYFSGGQIEFILEKLLWVESFKTENLVELWRSLGIARTFMEEHLPFWEMEPADSLVDGASTITVGTGKNRSFQLGAQLFHKPGEVYAIYFPATTETGTLNLTQDTGTFQGRWFNPRTGKFQGNNETVSAGKNVKLGNAPAEPEEDWVYLLKRM